MKWCDREEEGIDKSIWQENEMRGREAVREKGKNTIRIRGR